MSIKDEFEVIKIDNKFTKEWLLNKHYAHRTCSISYAYGLFNSDKIMVGVCTFGYPPNYNFNNGKCVFSNYEVMTLELNRLITDDGLPPNTLSYFVSQSLKLLPKPSCIVSYADPNNGHHGYIYQATNWIYTGDSTPKHRYIFEDGYTFDVRRGIDEKEKEHGQVIEKIKLKPTKRYIFFNGNKKDIKEMNKHFKLQRFDYPKGDNILYDASYKCKKIHLNDIEKSVIV